MEQNLETPSGEKRVAGPSPYYDWEKMRAHACFHPITREDSSRLLKWIAAVSLILFPILVGLSILLQ